MKWPIPCKGIFRAVMAMTDAEVAMACDAWLAATDMTGTIFADGWPEKRTFLAQRPDDTRRYDLAEG